MEVKGFNVTEQKEWDGVDRTFEIWMEGYAASGDSSGSSFVGRSHGTTFDEAISNYMKEHPRSGIEENKRERYMSEEAYNNRRSNWNIWGCSLFNNEGDARKSFG